MVNFGLSSNTSNSMETPESVRKPGASTLFNDYFRRVASSISTPPTVTSPAEVSANGSATPVPHTPSPPAFDSPMVADNKHRNVMASKTKPTKVSLYQDPVHKILTTPPPPPVAAVLKATSPLQNMSDVDLLIQQAHDDKHAIKLLRGAIGELVPAVHVLQQRLDKAQHQLKAMKSAQMEQVLTKGTLTGGNGSASSAKDRARIDALVAALAKTTSEPVQLLTPDGPSLSSEKATELVIHTFKKKMEKLSHENTLLQERNEIYYEKMHDLESQNEAAQHKIEALEIQFKTINKTRQKVVSKIMKESASKSSSNRLSASSSAYGSHAKIVKA